jgi:hypothetical protein
VFQNRLLRKIKWDKVTGGWRKLLDEEHIIIFALHQALLG